MTLSIKDIDPNFKALEIDGTPLVFQTADRPPFRLSGLPWYAQERQWCRLPQTLLPSASDGVRWLGWNTSGVRVHFRTDSSAIGLHATLRDGVDMSHMARSGSGGFDLYEGSGSAKVFRSNLRHDPGCTAVRGLFCRAMPPQMREWTVYFPLYSGVSSFSIGLDPDSRVEPPAPFDYEHPVLFYGSSITQGGCASRPGNSHAAIITRRLNADLVNWGFSGNAIGEPVMARTIATLNLSAFVLDYDHNAPSAEHLDATHEPFFRIIRQAHPDLPVVFVSKPDFYGTSQCLRRRDLIRRTWEKASSAGDRRVWFVDGETLFGSTERDLCTVDGCHPNDIGFLRMADAITPVLRDALNSRRG